MKSRPMTSRRRWIVLISLVATITIGLVSACGAGKPRSAHPDTDRAQSEVIAVISTTSGPAPSLAGERVAGSASISARDSTSSKPDATKRTSASAHRGKNKLSRNQGYAALVLDISHSAIIYFANRSRGGRGVMFRIPYRGKHLIVNKLQQGHYCMRKIVWLESSKKTGRKPGTWTKKPPLAPCFRVQAGRLNYGGHLEIEQDIRNRVSVVMYEHRYDIVRRLRREHPTLMERFVDDVNP